MADGTAVDLACYEHGTNVNGENDIWYRLNSPYPGGFAYAGYITTPNDPVSDVGSCTGTDGTPDDRADAAVSWFAARDGSTAYEQYCQFAVEQSYGTSEQFLSARAAYDEAVRRGVLHQDMSPPKGAWVYWPNLANGEGHVGVGDGQGGFWATSVGGAIHQARLPYYGTDSYGGWSPPLV